jgi:hypothetical protein
MGIRSGFAARTVAQLSNGRNVLAEWCFFCFLSYQVAACNGSSCPSSTVASSNFTQDSLKLKRLKEGGGLAGCPHSVHALHERPLSHARSRYLFDVLAGLEYTGLYNMELNLRDPWGHP